MCANSRRFLGRDAVPRDKILIPNVARTLVLSLGEMERRVSKLTYLLAAVLACAAGVSCGAGVHDGDQAQTVAREVVAGDTIEFMDGQLDICKTCLGDSSAKIKLTWHRAIDYAGALSAVYDLEVENSRAFQSDPTITIFTTDEIASKDYNVIGFLVPPPGESVWIPDTSPSPGGCAPKAVCGPVQSQVFQSTNIIRLAIVTKCYRGPNTQCPRGQSCAVANACQQCPKDSPCQ
jgi:hypothetical protein